MKKYTYNAKASDNKDKWLLVDAEGKILGRLASQIAARLRGKCNPLYTPHVDMGDSVVVINAEKILMTGRKLDQKNYYRHSGYTGGLKTITAKKLLEKRPEDVLRIDRTTRSSGMPCAGAVKPESEHMAINISTTGSDPASELFRKTRQRQI